MFRLETLALLCTHDTGRRRSENSSWLVTIHRSTLRMSPCGTQRRLLVVICLVMIFVCHMYCSFNAQIPLFIPAFDLLKYKIYHFDKLIYTMYVNVDTSLSAPFFPHMFQKEISSSSKACTFICILIELSCLFSCIAY